MRCDFHLHTTMSDGRATPENLVFRACARDLDLIAVTDHDTTAGVEAAQAEGEELGVKVIPGVELSAQAEGAQIHLICLGFDPRNQALEALLARIRRSRVRASRETLDALAQAGYGAAMPEAEKSRSLCRPHLADALIRAGHARTRPDAFNKFLASDTYRSPYELPTAEEAIATVHAAGGVAIYAHPRHDEIDVLAPWLKERGLDGIEVFRASFPSSARSLYCEETARRLDLMVAGGSDWHGLGSLGQLALERDLVAPLVERVA
ncbi:MAG TPA: PHP domain-containing protein [Planctomycetota bacterium]|nr:PHP domain-containing protein [Planctomycetota bacterium]